MSSGQLVCLSGNKLEVPVQQIWRLFLTKYSELIYSKIKCTVSANTNQQNLFRIPNISK